MENIPIYISGIWVAYVSFKALGNAFKNYIKNETNEIIKNSQEIEFKLKLFNKKLKKYKKNKNKINIDFNSNSLLVINKLEKSLHNTLKIIRFLKETYDEDEFASACEYFYHSPLGYDNENQLLEHDFFSMAEEEFDHEWRQISDGLHTEKHKAMWRILINVNKNNQYYINAANYFALNEISVRKYRTKDLNCINDIDFIIKLHAIRNIFDLIFSDNNFINWVIECVEDIFVSLMILDERPTDKFIKAFKKFVEFCKDTNNYIDIKNELNKRGVVVFSFYDVIFDFGILDNLDEMDTPPAAVKSVLSSSLIPYYAKKKSLDTLISSQINSKRERAHPDSLMFYLYDFIGDLSCTLACGLLCSSGVLNDCCKLFLDEFKEFATDCFSTLKSNYQSEQTLLSDIERNFRSRLARIHAACMKSAKREKL